MQIVDRPAATIVGIEVVAPSRICPWSFRRRGRACSLGAVVDVPPVSLPEGWSLGRAPAGRYLHHRHPGDETRIGDSFADMYRWAQVNDLRPGPRKIDVGYRADHSGPTSCTSS